MLHKLARRSDVFLHNVRPDTAQRIGIDYEAIRAQRPDIIYFAVREYGSGGPYQKSQGMNTMENPNYETLGGRTANIDELYGLVADTISKQSTEYWRELFGSTSIRPPTTVDALLTVSFTQPN